MTNLKQETWHFYECDNYHLFALCEETHDMLIQKNIDPHDCNCPICGEEALGIYCDDIFLTNLGD